MVHRSTFSPTHFPPHHAPGEVLPLIRSGGGGGGPAPATYDFYVDSVNGNNANPGTLAAPFQTIAAAQTALTSSGTSIGLFKGSSWRETLTIPRDNFTVGVVGSGSAPVFDGADVIVGTWVKHADTVNYPDVWQIANTRGTATATEYLGLWVDGVRPAYQTSLTNLQASGGWNASSLTGTNPTIYIKSATNPNSNGSVYEVSKRSWGINGHTASLGVTRTATVTGPLEMKRCHGHYNAMAGGPGSQSALWLRDGNIHHTVTEATGTVEDVICTEYAPHWTSEAIPLTFYRSDGSAWDAAGKRLMVDESGAYVSQFITGIYAHDSIAGGVRSLALEQCYTRGCRYGISASSLTLVNRGQYSFGDAVGCYFSQASTTVTHGIFRAGVSGVGGMLHDAGPVSLGLNTRVVENCVFYMPAGAASNPSCINLGTRNGSLTIRNCIFFLADVTSITTLIAATGSTGIAVTLEYCVFVRTTNQSGIRSNLNLTGASSTITSDHNIFIGDVSTDGGSQIDMSFLGTTYRTLALWQAQGKDLNSVHVGSGSSLATIISTYFAGDPTAGDFRLKAGLGTFGDGVSLNLAGPQEHWDWNTRGIVPGAPTQWPVPPATNTERRAYIADPAAWDFYP